MREALPLAEFARLVGVPVDELETYCAHGLLDPEGDGLFDDVDLVRLDTVRHYLDQGWSPEDLSVAIDAGTVEAMLDDILFDRGPTYTLEQAAERAGRDVEQLRALRTALGLSRPVLHERDLQMLDVFKTVSAAGLPWEAILEGARVMGDTLRRLAETEVRLVHVYIHERLIAAGASEEDVSRQIFGFEKAMTPLLEPLIQHVHRHHLLQAAIEDMFLHLMSASTVPTTLGSVQTTIVFADVASFTSLADTEGDEAAAQVLDQLDGIVRALALEHEGKLVKQIGDGFMLVFRRPPDAVHFAVGLQDLVRRAGELPAVRIGINTGAVLHRAGDYVGSAVNVASRVSSAAMPGQILATDTVVKEVDDDAIELQEVGVRLLRGVDEPFALWRVMRTGEERDPVCGAEVGSRATTRLRRDGRDVGFCSEECLRRFVEDPLRYAAS
jgi:adenylate cyclase